MPSKKIHIKCEVCCELLQRRESDILCTIDRNGFYICKQCSLISRNKKNARKLWSKRTHKHRNRPQIKTRGGWIDLHVHILESYLCRKLEHGECVHHCDKNVFNNNIKNLELMTNGAHTTLHNTGRVVSDKTKKKMSLNSKGKPSKSRSITFEIAERIRNDISSGKYTYKSVAKKYNTTKGIVAHIIKNRSYTTKDE